jgi:hypothetical protein
VHLGDVVRTMTVHRYGGWMSAGTRDFTVDAVVVLVEAQLSLVRYLIRHLVREGAPPASLVRFHAELDQIEATVTHLKARLSPLT